MLRYLFATTVLVTLLLGGILSRCIFEPELVDSLRWRLGLPQPEIPQFNQQMRSHLARLASSAFADRVVFIGDSFVQQMDVSEIDCGALNLGIGGDTTHAVLRRLGDYSKLKDARAIVLLVGTNDLWRRDTEAIAVSYRDILQRLKPLAPMLVVGVPPIDDTIISKETTHNHVHNKHISQLNRKLAKLCEGSCFFIPSHDFLAGNNGRLASPYSEQDGIHLSARGYSVLNQRIRESINDHVGATHACHDIPMRSK